MQLKLFMLLLGCRPAGRNTEQHDVFFGVGETLKDLIPDIKKFWPAAKSNIHIDAWRSITAVNGYAVQVTERAAGERKKDRALFFINLGGYKENEFDEFHYKMLVAAGSMEQAKNISKQSAFFKHTSLAAAPNNHEASAHIDNKYGIDVDDIYAVEDILPAHLKDRFSLQVTAADNLAEDEINLGYYRLVDL